MSSATPHIDALAESALNRKPRQGRSLASFERMLAASKELLLERGSEEFTLQDVSERGNVSIGSIYLRFESKDRLLHAVIARELQEIISSERAMLDLIIEEADGLGSFLDLYIERYSKFLQEHAILLGTIMQRAAIDPAVSEPGKETGRLTAAMSVEAILLHRSEIAGECQEKKVQAAFQIIFATIARQFGLGSTLESGDKDVWKLIKSELAKMALAYLRHAD